jgi:hypothetical protein
VDIPLSKITLRPDMDILSRFEVKVKSLVVTKLSQINVRSVVDIRICKFWKKVKATGGHNTFSNNCKASCGHIITFWKKVKVAGGHITFSNNSKASCRHIITSSSNVKMSGVCTEYVNYNF